MRLFFNLLGNISKLISALVFICGLIMLSLAVVDLIHTIMITFEQTENKPAKMAVGLLQTVDFVLLSIVFFIFSIGITLLFKQETEEKAKLFTELPKWLQIKSLTELKIILWEAILTTFIITYIGDLALHKIIKNEPFSTAQLILPGAILILALSLYFLKKGE
ncbi:YqhA family protein [Flavobacterium sp. C4GT6]|uniref:YqhA family protein n=1 Tax=Flavobacterium sp. C4GT6 TaxID=3103818 RepID=UPI002ECFDF12